MIKKKAIYMGCILLFGIVCSLLPHYFFGDYKPMKALEPDALGEEYDLYSYSEMIRSVPFKDYEKPVEYWESLNNTENGDASSQVAIRYLTGQRASRDFNKAMQVLQTSSDEEDVNSIYLLAICYIYGDPIDVNNEWKGRDFGKNQMNKARGEHYLIKAAELGHSGAQYRLGLYYLRMDEPKKGVAWLKKAWSQKHFNAGMLLAECYVQGTGTLFNISNPVMYAKVYKELKDYSDEYYGKRKSIRIQRMHVLIELYKNEKYFSEFEKDKFDIAKPEDTEYRFQMALFYLNKIVLGELIKPDKTFHVFEELSKKGDSRARELVNADRFN